MDGSTLREWRVGHGLTQPDLATLLKVGVRTISRWETSGSEDELRLVKMALKGLLFTHGDGCPCAFCYARRLKKNGPTPNRRDPR